MSRRFVIASAVLLVATVRAAPPTPPPDFWYVVPDAASAAARNRPVQGIVIPSSVDPTVETSPTGSVISWQRPDGSRQSVVVAGISSFTFKPGPLKGTTFVPFADVKHMAWTNGSCCTCASWERMVESPEFRSCIPGCQNCGCEACICTHEDPCPHAFSGGMTLVAHNDASAIMTLDEPSTPREVALANRNGNGVKIRGKRLSTEVGAKGNVEIANPDSIAIPGRVTLSNVVQGDKAMHAWSSPGVTVIVEQPLSLAPPSFHDGTIDFKKPQADAPTNSAITMQLDNRCWVCGYHPDSVPDYDKWECVPGEGACVRCITFECLAHHS